MKPYEFIGLADKEELLKTTGQLSWEAVSLDYIPFKSITYAPGYLFTLGSGNLSLATTSIYGLRYVSGIRIFRHDFNSIDPAEPLINVDSYLAGSVSPTQFGIFKENRPLYHWPSLSDPIIQDVPKSWEGFVRMMLTRK